jgi:thioesterase domain-containing protein
MGAAPLLRGGFEVIRVAGGHHAMLEQPHRGDLVALLAEVIGQDRG